ncbi:MAG: hypothetical protein AAGK00_17445 [Pseudomonadota bacterium]
MAPLGLADGPARFAPAVDPTALRAGAHNLLLGCAEVQPGHRVAILHEDPAFGWYDRAAPEAVAEEAGDLGALVRMVEVPAPGGPLPDDLAGTMDQADIVIWFARIGDQDRFGAGAPNRTTVVSYARTAAALASGFGTRPHADMVALKHAIDARLAEAESITVTCPLGTHLHGTQDAAQAEDVSVRRFPMSVHRPIPARGFSGQVALKGYLTPTGSRSYAPANVPITDVVMAQIQDGRIVGFQGGAADVTRVRAHHAHVADLFGIDPNAVHSFHAGIHPGCIFTGQISDDPDLWSNTVFGSPRWLHFHTCGDYPPGEICWMIEGPTLSADGAAIWSEGKLADITPTI